MEVRIASMSKRVAAFFIDIIMCTIIICLIALPLGYGRAISDYMSFLDNEYARWVTRLWRDAIEFFAFLLYVLYCIIMESSYNQATFGKQIMKIKVVDFEGRKLYLKEAAKRNLFKIISRIPLSLGFIWAFFTDRKQAWHDMFAKTLVVDTALNVEKVTDFEENGSNEIKSNEAMDRFEFDQENKGYKINGYEYTSYEESSKKSVIPPWIVLLVIFVVIVFIAVVLFIESLKVR